MKKNYFDIAVIGGGPAGMMAAGRAAEMGAKVVLIEKNNSPGKKLLLTGKGRCNITNYITDNRHFIDAFGSRGKFFHSPLNKFGVEETIRFFNEQKLDTVVERGNRVFPEMGGAKGVLNVLKNYARKNKVKFLFNTAVKEFINEESHVAGLKLIGSEVFAHAFILCTGGLSYPRTGSTGDGYNWVERMGHSIIPLQPALVPIKLEASYSKELNRLILKNVSVGIYHGDKKIDQRFGEASFTNDGMDGPVILDMSKKMGEHKEKSLQLKIDLKPALDYKKLDMRIRRDLEISGNSELKNSLFKLLPKKIVPVIIKMSKIKTSKKASTITREERKRLLNLIKEFPFQIKGICGYERAIVTSGGISLDEIYPKTMKSKLVDNLFFAGEIVDLDGPTGGFNLQVCWSTGYVAGEEASKFITSRSVSG
ncbi:NAD(P)/FAD-dependent oxidoreductase [Spirochaetota bacterium]